MFSVYSNCRIQNGKVAGLNNIMGSNPSGPFCV